MDSAWLMMFLSFMLLEKIVLKVLYVVVHYSCGVDLPILIELE